MRPSAVTWQKQPDGVFIEAGDFNQMNIPGSYKALPQSRFGHSEHISFFFCSLTSS